MTHTATNNDVEQTGPHTIECPVCHSHGAAIHHDIRSSLLYSCETCQHEWQLAPPEEPLDADPAVSPGPMKG